MPAIVSPHTTLRQGDNLPSVVLHSTKVLDEAELAFFSQNTTAIFPKQTLALPDSAARVRELMKHLAAHGQKNQVHA